MVIPYVGSAFASVTCRCLSSDPLKDALITETLVSVITQGITIDADGGELLIAVKTGKAKNNLVLEPHDIVKEVRLLSSLSHPAVRLHITSPSPS